MVLGILLKLILKTNEHEMQTFPVILSYYANTRQMPLILSQRNLTKKQTAIKNKSLRYCFTMPTATEDIVLRYPSAQCISFVI